MSCRGRVDRMPDHNNMYVDIGQPDLLFLAQTAVQSKTILPMPELIPNRGFANHKDALPTTIRRPYYPLLTYDILYGTVQQTNCIALRTV